MVGAEHPFAVGRGPFLQNEAVTVWRCIEVGGQRSSACACARRGGADVVEIEARNVGAARAAGVTEVLRTAGVGDPAAIWIACTDADTRVPPDWLTRQLRHAEAGWDAVVGTVTVTDWTEHPAELPALFEARYRSGGREHRHVHGVNLSFNARAYLTAGGFPPTAPARTTRWSPCWRPPAAG